MADEDKDRTEWEKTAEFWEERLAGGEPIQVFVFDHPVTFYSGSEGGLLMDCACMRIGPFDTLGVVRVILTPVAEDSLRRFLADHESTADERGGAPKAPRAQ